MKTMTFKMIASVVAITALQACVFDESGTEYQQPDNNTSPVVNLNYNASHAVNTYLTFTDDSADIAVTFGSQTVTFPSRSEMRLQGFGGFDTDRVWKTSVVEDSRGIKTLRMGYYTIGSSSNDIEPPTFHNFARDSRGNIYLTETAEQLKSDLGVAPFRQASGALIFPANIAVGDSWVAGPTLIPMFYSFTSGSGWTATLVDDDATAPMSGTEGCVVIKYYRESYAFYLYLKDGLGIVEWINSWEEDDSGNVKPINGFAISDQGDGETSIPYTGYGWASDSRNPVGSLFDSVGLKVVNGEEANFESGDSSPVNNSGYGFTRITSTTEAASSSYPQLEELRVPDIRGEESVDFADSRWDSLSGDYYRPYIEVTYQGNTYIADDANGDFVVEKIYNQPYGPAMLSFWGHGTLVNSADSSDTFDFTGLMEGLYLNAGADGLTPDFAIIGMDVDRRLPAAKPGSSYRIYASYAYIDEPLEEVLDVASESLAEFGDAVRGIGYTSTCFGDRSTNDTCNSTNVAFQFVVPDIEGELALRIGGQNAAGEVTSVSQVFYLPVSSSATKSSVTARLYDQFNDVIRGSLDDSGEFVTGYLNATSSVALGSNIVKYSFDMGDGTVVEDAPALGTYTYTANGEYQLAMTVTNDQGQTSTAYRKVKISDTGELVVRNIGDDFGSGFFTIAIDDLDEPDGYYDYYKFVTLDKNEESVFEVPGDVNYQVDIIVNGEVVYSDKVYVAAADQDVVEVDLD
ncbi:PKD domain-containing protein [Oceanobacter mangrovi]|uniref:PKD domain-containing protein n=1 Tax=Oceanobacter mangrovi TaxID=2862510 RepID=UPI001C8E43A8|nr:PKD domain-containing protein [Oceanobacter mangrovi]